VVRNGHLPERTILTGVGPVEVEQSRVRDRRPAGEREAFTPAILPPYLRKTRSLGAPPFRVRLHRPVSYRTTGLLRSHASVVNGGGKVVLPQRWC
jgi:hypothetical protein